MVAANRRKAGKVAVVDIVFGCDVTPERFRRSSVHSTARAVMRRWLPPLIALCLASCAPAAPQPSTPAPPNAATMDDLSSRFLRAYLEANPVRATEAGDHRYDHLWPDMSEESERAWLARLDAFERELASVAATDVQRETDRSLLANEIARQRWATREGREAVTNPLLYTGLVGDGLDPLVTRGFAPADARAASLTGRLAALPPLLDTAKRRLKNPPELHTRTAILQNQGLVELVAHIDEHLGPLSADARARLRAAAVTASAALVSFGRFLADDLLPRSRGDERLGRARFDEKLRLTLDDPTLDVDGLVADAERFLVTTRREMTDTAKELWPTLPTARSPQPSDPNELVRVVLAELAKDRPTNATIVAEAAEIVRQATTFVKTNDLVRVPDEPCRVIEMPEYRRGVAIAYCDSSGPLEQTPETFYAISPTPKDWDAKRTESFYKEYNRAMLIDLSVHEAMPGHFLQIAHNNAFPSKLRAVFSSGAFVEGWAVYAEWLLSQRGFGGPKVRLMRQKMALRMAMNTVLDHGVHAGSLSERDALKRMTDEAFQEEGEAVGKWTRARLTSAQLTTYFYGYRAMMGLRAKATARPGFSERAYHDRLLSFGSPAPRYLDGLVLAR